MAEQSTNTTTPEVPDWAREAVDALSRVSVYAAGHLAPAEQDLLDAVFILLRGRFGESVLTDPETIARGLAMSALRELGAELVWS